MNKKYGEVKVRKNIYPKQAQEIVDKGFVGIVLLENEPSQKTIDVFTNANVTVFAGLEHEYVKEKKKEIDSRILEKNKAEKE